MSEFNKTQKHGNVKQSCEATRFADHVDYFGDESIHFGRMIDCAPGNEADPASGASGGC